MPRYARDSDATTELMEFLKYKLDDQAYLKAELMVKAIAGTSATDDDPDDSSTIPGAMDQRMLMAFDFASTSAGRIVADREVAISEVEATVGRHTVLACDSAASVFKAALKQMGVPTTGIHPSALPAIFRAHRDRMRRGSGDGGSPRPYVAQDARGTADFDRRFPDIGRLKAI
jgi:hypothetical protein